MTTEERPDSMTDEGAAPDSAPIGDITDLDEVEQRMDGALKKLSDVLGMRCHPFFLPDNLTYRTVDDSYLELRTSLPPKCNELAVIVDSSGGDINAAYNLAQLFRHYATKKLFFIVPRWAKSAASLLACAGDLLFVTPVAELGPLDPQFRVFNPLETRLEEFSPLHIEATLQLIRDEYEKGNPQLAEGLVQRLQFPLTLGNYKTSLELGRVYMSRLLESRMMKGAAKDKVEEIARRFTEGYPDHAFCILGDELKDMGLKVEELKGAQLDFVWDLHLLEQRQRAIEDEIKRREIDERLRNLPPGIIPDPADSDDNDVRRSRR